MNNIEKVENILNKLNINEPPIPLERVAGFFALSIIEYPKFPDSVSGTIIKDDDLLAIGVNSNHPKVRQRFTAAHELGHYILNHDQNKVLDDTFDKSSNIEVEANKFASELLMPKKMLKKDLDNQSWDIPRLSQRYGVSEQAMSVRLLEANFINHSNLGRPE